MHMYMYIQHAHVIYMCIQHVRVIVVVATEISKFKRSGIVSTIGSPGPFNSCTFIIVDTTTADQETTDSFQLVV